MPAGLFNRPNKHCMFWVIIFILCSVVFEGFIVSMASFAQPSSGSFTVNLEQGLDQEITADQDAVLVYQPPTSTRLSRSIEPAWPMFGKDMSHSHVADQINKGIYEPTIRWDGWNDNKIVGFGIDSWGTTIGNFSNNIVWPGGNRRNVQHVVYAEDGFINIVDGANGDYVWRLNADLIDSLPDNDLVYTSPTLGFFDNNDQLDIIFGTTDGNLFMYEPESNYDSSDGYYWSSNNVNSDRVWQLSTGENFTHSSPVLALLDQDDYLDLVVSASNKLFALSTKTGNELWNQTLPGNMVSTPIVYQDGTKKNVLITAFNITNYNYSASFFDAQSPSGNRLDVLYYNINTLPTPDLIPSPAAAELDGNKNNDFELVICTPYEDLGNGRVYVYNNNRTLLWSTPENFIYGHIAATPAIGDLDGDDIPEIVIISWGLGTLGPITHAYAFHGNNGSLLWHIVKDTIGMPPLYTNERAIGSPILADVNTDNKLDVIFTTSPDIYAVSGENGTDLWEITFAQTGRELWSTPAAGDVNNDGFLDVIIECAVISHVIIDLSLETTDVSLSSETVTQNMPVTIKATIHNNGTADARNAKISFFENDKLIGNGSDTIPGKDSREIRVEWTPKNEGTRTLKVIIDPENFIEENNENNNEISKEIFIEASYPDLAIEDVKYYRGDGKEVDNDNLHLIEDENATINITVKNIGADVAENIKVRVLDSNLPIDEVKEITDLDLKESKWLIYVWRPELGSHDLKVQVDFGNTIEELNETNNEHKDLVIVNSKDPTNLDFKCDGRVFQPEDNEPAVGVEVVFKNNRTGSQKSTTTNSTGYYSIDLKTLPDQYQEGDEIIIHASDGENESTIKFNIYSEDKNRFDNLTLVMVPTYAITLSVDSSSKVVYPNEEITYDIIITNRGNKENTVNLSLSEIKDVQSSQSTSDWNAYLNEYMVRNIPPRSSQGGIVLTLKAPQKNDQARALDQVLVAVTAKSVFDPKQMDILGMTTTVGRVYDFILDLDETEYDLDPFENQTVEFGVDIKNNGNDDDIGIIDLDMPENWNAKYNDTIELLLGEEKRVEIILECDIFVGAGDQIINIQVSSIDGKGNTSTQLTVNILRPDLKFFNDVTMTPSDPKLSEVITFDANIYNNGSSYVAACIVEFRVDGSAYESKIVYNLSADDFEQISFQWTPTDAGEYLLEFEIDPDNNIIEADTENNIFELELEFKVDVALLNKPVFSKDNPVEGERIKISITVDNIGSVDITKSFQIDFYDGEPSMGGKRFARYTLNDDLTAGDDVIITVSWKTTGGGRQHTIYVEANPEINFTENDYDNNAITATIQISNKPRSEEFGDYTSWILLIFFVAIIIIVFLVLTPSKHPSSSRSGQYKNKYKGKGKDKGKAKPKDRIKHSEKRKTMVKDLKKGVKFIELGAETEEEPEKDEEEELEVNELGRVEPESIRRGEGSVSKIEDKVARKSTTKSLKEPPKTRKSHPSPNLVDTVTERLTGLFGGLGKGKRPLQSKSESKTKKDKIAVEVEEVETVPEVVEEIEEIEVDVAEVLVIGDGEDGTEAEVVEVEELEYDDGEDEETKKKRKTVRSINNRNGKSKKESGLDYSHMIGIR